MENYNKIFLPYVPKAEVNYIYLFYLYGIAVRYEDRKQKDDICFSSFRELEERINGKYAKDGKKVVSQATLRRVALSEKYKDFFFYDKNYCGRQGIILQNDFSGDRGKKSPFVVLNRKTYNFLITQADNLLAKYTIFLKYQCGRGGNKTDFTADQFLQAIGYSTKAGNTKSLLGVYNRLLQEQGIITVKPIRIDGKQRNIYSFIDV